MSNSSVDAIQTFDSPVTFTSRPRMVRAEQRVAWRLSALALVLNRFNKKAASIQHLHIVGWALRSPRSRQAFLMFWEGKRTAGSLTDRFDPNLAVTLNLALAHGLIDLHSASRRVALTDDGAALASEIEGQPDLLRDVKSFLNSLGDKLSDAKIEKTFAGPVRSDA